MVKNRGDTKNADELMKLTLKLVSQGKLKPEVAKQFLDTFKLVQKEATITRKIARSPIFWSAVYALLKELLDNF
jgi:polyhydroxyalkanoate synthesis regulator phasin